MKTISDYSPYLSVLSETNLLRNIPTEYYPEIFQFLQASLRQYKKGEYLQHLGDPLKHSGIVVDGNVEGSFLSENYNKINMNHFSPGRSFGEALALAGTTYSPIQLKALTDCTVLFLRIDRILHSHDILANPPRDSGQHPLTSADPAASDYPFLPILTGNVIRLIARQNVFSNLKLRIANQKTLRDKLMMYLQSLAPDKNGYLHIPFTQTALAEFLGANRSALSRELGRMQDEELIYMDGKKIKLR